MDLVPEYKIILLGEPGVGKTSFFFRLRDGVFVGNTTATVSTGIDHMEYKMRINGYNIKAILYDTAGGERYRTLTANYYHNADAAILMYSVEDSYSFERLKDEVENAMKFVNHEDFVWALVGHKGDLSCEIAHDSIVAWAAQLNTKLNFFASAKTGENVVQLFDRVVAHVHRVRRGRPIRSQSFGALPSSGNVPLINKSAKENSCSC